MRRLVTRATQRSRCVCSHSRPASRDPRIEASASAKNLSQERASPKRQRAPAPCRAGRCLRRVLRWAPGRAAACSARCAMEASERHETSTLDELDAAASAPRPSLWSRHEAGGEEAAVGPRPDKVASPKLDELLSRLASAAAAHHAPAAAAPQPPPCAKCGSGIRCTTVAHSCGQLGRAATAGDADAAIAVATSLVARGHRCVPPARRSSGLRQRGRARRMRRAAPAGALRACAGSARGVKLPAPRRVTASARGRRPLDAPLRRRLTRAPTAQHVFPALDAPHSSAGRRQTAGRSRERAPAHGGLRCACRTPAATHAWP